MLRKSKEGAEEDTFACALDHFLGDRSSLMELKMVASNTARSEVLKNFLARIVTKALEPPATELSSNEHASRASNSPSINERCRMWNSSSSNVVPARRVKPFRNAFKAV